MAAPGTVVNTFSTAATCFLHVPPAEPRFRPGRTALRRCGAPAGPAIQAARPAKMVGLLNAAERMGPFLVASGFQVAWGRLTSTRRWGRANLSGAARGMQLDADDGPRCVASSGKQSWDANGNRTRGSPRRQRSCRRRPSLADAAFGPNRTVDLSYAASPRSPKQTLVRKRRPTWLLGQALWKTAWLLSAGQWVNRFSLSLDPDRFGAGLHWQADAS